MKSMENKFFRNKFSPFGIIVFLLLFISACGSSSSTTAPVTDGRTYSVTLLQTTDMHARAASTVSDPAWGGFAMLAAKINEVRDAQTTAGAEVMLVDSGDYFMGTVFDFLWDTDPASLQFIQAMGYDLITLGNHEFDYGPAKLATMITASQSASAFSVPILASNTVFSAASTADDALEALQTAGAIVPTFVKTLPNGLKIGFIGLMGPIADGYSPAAPPVTFNHDYAYIQGIVNNLRSVQGANVVIALSHSGIEPGTTPTGDDVLLAANITGIDIIASGHDHEMTPAIIDIPNTATPSNITHIICAGANTSYLAQLDFTATATGVTDLSLTIHNINDFAIPTPDAAITTMVDAMVTDVNALILPLGPTSIAEIEATNGAFSLHSGTGEHGLGNMLADSLRYAGTSGDEFTIGGIASGVIRDGYAPNQSITFADVFSMVPLGISTATDQDPLYPGYPLLKVYLTGEEIWDVCTFNALIMALGQYTSYFVHLSGIQYTHSGGAVSSVNQYHHDDYQCILPTTALAHNSTQYPVIIDTYVMNMLLSPSLQGLLNLLGLSIQPKLVDGTTLVNASNMLTARLDRDAVTVGVQEEYAWSALLDYFTYTSAVIPAQPYDFAVRTSPARINPVP